MNSTSQIITFKKSCATGFGASSDFCHELVVDTDLSPNTQMIDPCPHLFLRYYTSDSSDIDIHTKNSLFQNHGFVKETVKEVIPIINGSGSLKYCPFGNISFSWSGLSMSGCQGANGLITFKGKDIKAPSSGMLTVSYVVGYYLLEIIPTDITQNTVVVCQNGVSSTYLFTPSNCIMNPGQGCCESIQQEITNLNNELFGDSLSSAERAVKQHRFNILTRGIYIDPIEVFPDVNQDTIFHLYGHGGCPPYVWSLTDSTRKDIKLQRPSNLQNQSDDTFFFLNKMGLQCNLLVVKNGIGVNDVVLQDACGKYAEFYVNLAHDCDQHSISLQTPGIVFPNNQYDIKAFGIAPFTWYFCSDMGVEYQIDFAQKTTYDGKNALIVFDHIGGGGGFPFKVCVTDACGHTTESTITYNG